MGKLLNDIINSVRNGEPDMLMLNLQTYFSKISYRMKMENENNFQNVFYALTVILGINSHVEYATSNGRIDILIETKRYIYIIELKYDRSAKEALRQIEETHYARPWQTDRRTIFKIGANFSSKSRTIEDWEIS